MRRFLIRYPQGPFYIVGGLILSGFSFPLFQALYYRMTMNKEDFIEMQERRRKEVKKLLVSGKFFFS
ncbi:unnamed protein product [Dracunculus medinensis]|uniref:Uncharacterized protein n=1 Tax=Dracunculus medinensis TaxID=318479 RepID=A0A3P7PLU7_DRAME|nr:unnamed protein product [Dracunculus medinensis]